ncbi:MAG: CPBP family intramembrane metalloprotease [Nesterenkonia sp.]|nr:CPBP family intramembrane metalloprotease [Nesterenkonia sp.]
MTMPPPQPPQPPYGQQPPYGYHPPYHQHPQDGSVPSYGPEGSPAQYGQYGQYNPYGGFGHYAPPRRPTFRERFLPDAEPGRLSWWDLAATLVYLIGFTLGIIPMLVMLTPLGTMAQSADPADQAVGGFLTNMVSYLIVGAVVVLACWRPLARSVRAFLPLWWAKLLVIPVIWVTGIVCSGIAVGVLGLFGIEPEVSQNQQDIELMLAQVPFLASAFLMVVLAPLVEEYFFRHLLIGRLSRFINRWILGAVSVVLFALMHVTVELIDPTQTFNVAAVVPYVMMGVVFVLVYILSGRSLLYAWLVHAFFNLMALVMQYFVVPRLQETFPELDQTAGLLLLLLG